MNCSIKQCEVSDRSLLAIIDDGEHLIVLCAEHQMEYAKSSLSHCDVHTYPKQHGHTECEICSSPSIYYADEVELRLCERHLKKLLTRSLNTAEYKTLHDKYGVFELIHDDFYAKGGYALQPVYH